MSNNDVAPVLAPPQDPLRVRLNDARLVTIRLIAPSDLDALRVFFAALSRATLRLRFHSPVNELPEPLLREFTRNDGAHVALVAEAHGSAGNRPTTIVAEARYVREADSESAEFALVVADSWRGIGLGTRLTRLLTQSARLAGVLRLWGDVLEDNRAMRGLARSLGARLTRAIGCAQTVRLSLEV